MAMPLTHTARWLVEIFRQYSLSLEHWKAQAEAKTLNNEELQRRVRELEQKIMALTAYKEIQQRLNEEQTELMNTQQRVNEEQTELIAIIQEQKDLLQSILHGQRRINEEQAALMNNQQRVNETQTERITIIEEQKDLLQSMLDGAEGQLTEQSTQIYDTPPPRVPTPWPQLMVSPTLSESSVLENSTTDDKLDIDQEAERISWKT